MQDTVVAYLAIVVDLHTRIEDGMIANLDIIANIGMRVDLHTLAQLDILTDISKGTHICIFGHGNTFADVGRLLNTLFGRIHGFSHKGKQLAHGSTSVLHADERSTCLAIKSNGLGHEYYTGIGVGQMREVFGITEESELALLSSLNRTHIPYLAIGIARDLASEKHGYLLCREFHCERKSEWLVFHSE